MIPDASALGEGNHSIAPSHCNYVIGVLLRSQCNSLANLEAFAKTHQPTLRITKVCIIRVALNHADFCISLRKVSLKGKVVFRIASERVKILQRSLDDLLSRGRRTRQICDRVMHVKNERIRKLAEVIESTLCKMCLAERDDQSGANSQGNGNCRCYASLMPYDKLRSTVARCIFARHDGQVCKIASEISSKLFHGRIPTLWFLAQGHQHNVVQVTA